MRRTAAVLATSALLALTAACGGSDGEADSPSDEASLGGGSAQCNRLLPRKDVERLVAGEVVDPEDTIIGGMEACKWDGITDPGASVTIVRTPAEQWADKLPALIDQYEKTGMLEGLDKAKVDRALKLIQDGGVLDGDAACKIFTTMIVELQKQPAGATRIINWLPSQEEPQAVNIQTCEDGRYTSLQLIAGGLKGTAADQARLQEAYDALPS